MVILESSLFNLAIVFRKWGKKDKYAVLTLLIFLLLKGLDSGEK
jgi:hypothetical protein